MWRSLFKNGKTLLTKEHTHILSAAAVIMVTTALSALLGIIRNRLLIAYFYHQPQTLDVYWAAFRLPDMVFQILVVGALSAAFIPVYSQLLTHHPRQANFVASSIINFVLLVLLFLSGLIFLFAYPLSQLITHGFTPDQLRLMTSLTRIMILAQLFFGLSSFLTGIIQSHRLFLIPALSPLLYNLGIILGTLTLSSRLGIFGPAVGVVFGAFLHLLVQIPLARTLGFRYSWSWDYRNRFVRQITRLMFPRTLALSVAQLEQTAIVFLATALPQGSLTMIYIAQQLANLPVRLFGIPIGQASLPFFTKEKARHHLKKISTMLTNSILEILYLTLPASAIILVLRIPLVRLAYGATSFPWKATVTTGKLVAILSLAIVARSLVHLLIRVFYALHNTKTPFFVTLLTTTINIFLAAYLIFFLRTGITALAFSLTLTSIFETLILAILLFKHLSFTPPTTFFTSLSKMIFASFFTAVSLWVPLRLLDQWIFDTTRTIPLILLTVITFFIGFTIYLLLSLLLHLHQLQIFLKLFRQIGNWKAALAKTEEPLETPESTV